MSTAENLQLIYEKMFERFGPQHWWPAETPFEVMVGAILTQNTNWLNVQKAIDNLKRAGVLSFEKLVELPKGLLAEYIRPAGYYNIKAERLHNFLAMIRSEYGSSLDLFLETDTQQLRERLLSVKGIGPETADSILLYSADRPIFVVDAYTYRILVRHDLIDAECGYEEIQNLFMDNLEPEIKMFNEYHALLVRTGKEYCRKSKPGCEGCPLNRMV